MKYSGFSFLVSLNERLIFKCICEKYSNPHVIPPTNCTQNRHFFPFAFFQHGITPKTNTHIFFIVKYTFFCYFGQTYCILHIKIINSGFLFLGFPN